MTTIKHRAGFQSECPHHDCVEPKAKPLLAADVFTTEHGALLTISVPITQPVRLGSFLINEASRHSLQIHDFTPEQAQRLIDDLTPYAKAVQQ